MLPLQSAEAAYRRIGIKHAFNDSQNPGESKVRLGVHLYYRLTKVIEAWQKLE